MVISSKNPITTRYRVRSSSFPSNPGPFLHRLQHHLNSLKQLDSSSSASAATISAALSGVADLYSCAEEALTLHRGIVDGLLDSSLKLLDAATVARDAVARLREAAIDIQSALRRRRDDVDSVEELVARYTRSRKETMRTAKWALIGLQKMAEHDELNDDVLRCVGSMSISVIESLLAYMSTPLSYKCRGSRWRVVSRLMAARGDENELSDSDATLHGLLCGCGGKSRIGSDGYRVVGEMMERLERGLEGMENGLNGLFRQLVRTRASLLNVLSS